MPKDWLKLAGAAVLTIACGPRVELDDASSGASESSSASTTGSDEPPDPTMPGSTTSPGTTTFPGTTASDATSFDDSGGIDASGDDDEGSDFIWYPDGGSADPECDVWAQECPAGEKCAPWANDGGPHWNDTKCVPVTARPAQPGDSCWIEAREPTSGLDTCDLGSTCMFVLPGQGIGTCVANCQGSAGRPVCTEPGTECTIAYDGVIQQCLPTCNPLLDDCERGDCFPNGADGFTCGSTLHPPLGLGEPCRELWDCAGGSTCIDAERLPDCEEAACCTPWCDVTLEDSCPAPTACVPWFWNRAPAGLEAVGVCALP